MSESNYGKLESPAKYQFDWKARDGQLVYYDKSSESQKATALPLYLKVVNVTYAVKGFSQKGSVFSSEIYNLARDRVSVVLRKPNGKYKGIFNFQKYSEIKSELADYGAQLHLRLYCISKKGGLFVIQLRGLGFKSWIDYTNEYKDPLQAIKLTSEETTLATGKSHILKFEPTDDFETALSYGDARKLVNDYANAYLTEQFRRYKKYNSGDIDSPFDVEISDEVAKERKHTFEDFDKPNPVDIESEVEEETAVSEEHEDLPF